MLDATGEQKQTINVCVCVSLGVFCFEGPSRPLYAQVFDGVGHVAIGNLNKFWMRPARKTEKQRETDTPTHGWFCVAGRSCPTVIQVFDGDVPGAIED